MSQGATRHRRGFWGGVVVGFALALGLGLLLALVFPLPPALAPEAEAPPVGPAAPAAPETAAPAPARGGALIRTETPGPLIVERPAAQMPPDLPGLAPPVAPDVFEGAPSGSPSLVPPQGQ